MPWSVGWTNTTDVYDINHPYQEIPYEGIQYTNCRDYGHISRYKGLRQVVHNPDSTDERYMALETVNPFTTNADIDYYEVPSRYENRLDIIAYEELGSASYAWVIAYFNNIEDGFSVHEGQLIKIPKNISSLFNSGEILQTVPALGLNLGSE